MLAISPEGVIRHWTEVGKPHKDQMMELNSEVAFSVRLWEAKSAFYHHDSPAFPNATV